MTTFYTTGTAVHIHSPKGQYVGQIRRAGYRNWETVGNAKTAQAAMIKAVKAMTVYHKRARVLWCSDGYDPNVVMQLSR